MSVAGIVSEFDPFHNGHRYLIDTVRRELAPRAVVCVMSGHFTQRGEPAILDKFTRASLAVRGGADLVVELPVCCAVNGAREFAFGGVHILTLLGFVTHLCFGSETGDLALLNRAASLLVNEDDPFRDALKEQMEAGHPFGTAYARALRSVLEPGTDSAPDFPSSNDILALAYIKQLMQAASDIRPYAVKRVGGGHKDETFAGSYASGRSIRATLENEGVAESVKEDVPTFTFEALKECNSQRGREERMLDLLRYRLLSVMPSAIASAPGISEGLENVIVRSIRKAESYRDLVGQIRSRRYPESRVRRTLTQILLGVTTDHYALLRSQPPYVRVLAFNGTGASLIAEAKKAALARIVVNPGREDWGDAVIPSNLLLDQRASEIYGILNGDTLYNSSDLVNIPKIIRN